jgi:hypothetical protein
LQQISNCFAQHYLNLLKYEVGVNMAIDFIVGDILIVKQQYVKNTLTKQSRTAGLARTIQALEYFNAVSADVLDVGNTIIFEGASAVNRAFIKLLSTDTTNINYNGGRGVMLYFENDTFLNNSFEYSTAYLCDICSRRGLNNSGISIPKLAVVRYTGFDTATQLPTISLADATSEATAKVMGMAEEAVADGEIGSIIIEGALSGSDTSTFTINDTVYLSDTPGGISDVAGTLTSIVGRAHTIGDPGSISVKGEFPFTPSSSEIAGLFATQYRDFQPVNTTAPSATTLDVSTELSAQTPGGSPTTEGVVTTAPDNLVIVRQINGDDFIENVTPEGNKVQARITEASGVWTLSFFYQEEVAGVETVFDMTPYSGDTIVWFIQRAYLLNNLPSNNPSRSLPSDQIAAEVPDATATIKGKALLASNGTTTTAGSALDVSDARTGAVKGRANAGTVSGFEQIIRLIQGTGITVALVESGGELQFTISVSGGGGIDQSASASAGGTANITMNPGFTPRIGFMMMNNSWDHSWGVFAGTGAALQHGLTVTVTPVSAGASALYGAVSNYGWVCTSFTSSNVTLTGPIVGQGEAFVLGGT